jgi:hypothetical protein
MSSQWGPLTHQLVVIGKACGQALEQELLAVQFHQIQSEFKERVEEMEACLLQLVCNP